MTAPVLAIELAPKRLAWLAAGMRGWGYEDTLGALKACSDAGWDDTRICRETFRLLLIADSAPGDLRAMAGRPARAQAGMSEETRQLLAAAKEDCDAATPLVRKNDPPAA